MANRSSVSNISHITTKPKLTSQGNGKNTKYSATSRNSARKRKVGQGK